MVYRNGSESLLINVPLKSYMVLRPQMMLKKHRHGRIEALGTCTWN